MAATERITMTMRELDRFKVIQDVADGKLKPWRAAERLELATRQVRRLVARLREHGPVGLVSGHRSKPGNRSLDPRAADRALSIIRDRYADFGPTLACEKLWECHGIRLAKETVRKLMTEAGLWIPRRQRPPKAYQPRARLACLGKLIQIDGSDHRWFENRTGLHAAGVCGRHHWPMSTASAWRQTGKPNNTVGIAMNTAMTIESGSDFLTPTAPVIRKTIVATTVTTTLIVSDVIFPIRFGLS